ncbi:hypothetical protein Taro_046335, partial [Colocasia esculenta]|nr:hypothetical protein [Colocasia esculenta]
MRFCSILFTHTGSDAKTPIALVVFLLTTLCLDAQRRGEPGNGGKSSRFENARHLAEDKSCLRRIAAGFVRSLVVDVCNRRLPSVVLDRYRTYCLDPSGNWFVHFLLPAAFIPSLLSYTEMVFDACLCISCRRFWDRSNCSMNFSCGKEVITFEKESHARRIGDDIIFAFRYYFLVFLFYSILCPSDIMLKVLLIIQQLLQENKHGSKRDIYYMHPSVFLGTFLSCSCHLSASTVSGTRYYNIKYKIILHCYIFCPRHFGGHDFLLHTHIRELSERLLLMGWLRFIYDGRKCDCIQSPNTAYPIPVHVDEVEDVVCAAEYILVVEKESVFQRLANDGFCRKNHCVVITGRGYPDVSTRRFLRYLVEKLCLPVYCLVDCDPYGLDILMVYRFGSMQMAYDAKKLCVSEVRWLGVFPSDHEKYHLPDRCLLPLTPEEKKKAEAMLLRCYLCKEAPDWRVELERMLQRGVKFEIEALSVTSFSFLSEEYIPAK